MQSTKKLIQVLGDLVSLLQEEAGRNPVFAERLDQIVAGISSKPSIRISSQSKVSSAKPVPDVFAILQEKGEEEFRFWLRSLDAPTLRAIVKIEGYDASKNSRRWTEPDKFVALIFEQTIARARRGSAFLPPSTQSKNSPMNINFLNPDSWPVVSDHEGKFSVACVGDSASPPFEAEKYIYAVHGEGIHPQAFKLCATVFASQDAAKRAMKKGLEIISHPIAEGFAKRCVAAGVARLNPSSATAPSVQSENHMKNPKKVCEALLVIEKLVSDNNGAAHSSEIRTLVSALRDDIGADHGLIRELDLAAGAFLTGQRHMLTNDEVARSLYHFDQIWRRARTVLGFAELPPDDFESGILFRQ